MDTAKIFENGRSQAVRLPQKYRFNADEVVIQRLGDAVLLVPKESLWNTFMDGVNSFTEDIFENGRDQGGRRSGIAYDVYAGYQHLHLCDEEQTGKGTAAVPRGAGRRALHFLYHAGRIGVWHEA